MRNISYFQMAMCPIDSTMKTINLNENNNFYDWCYNQFIYFILTKTQNWVGLTVVNVSAVKNTLQLHGNVVQNYIAIGISSSAVTLKVVMKGL